MSRLPGTRGGSRDMTETRPEVAEAAAVAEVLATAQHLGAPVYFAHQTTAEPVDLVRAARRRGVRAYTETCPHYLALDESAYAGDHPERFVCCPPRRSPGTVAQLRSRALVGDVDALGSDHCCYSTSQKLEHRDDVTKMPNGLPASRRVSRSPSPSWSSKAVCRWNASSLCSQRTQRGLTGSPARAASPPGRTPTSSFSTPLGAGTPFETTYTWPAATHRTGAGN